MEKIDRIVTLFDIAGEVVKIAPVGSGWINDTYRVSTAGDVPDYVLQRINHRVFQDVDSCSVTSSGLLRTFAAS